MTSRFRHCKKAVSDCAVDETAELRFESGDHRNASVDPFLLSFTVVCYGFFKALFGLTSVWCERKALHSLLVL